MVTVKPRANKFGGACVECGHHVAEGAGRIDKGDRGWEVRHLDGQCNAAPAAAPTPHPARKNLYPGDCGECGRHLPAGAGIAVKGASGWGVRHRGDCPPPPAPLPEVPEGRYALDYLAEPGELTFWVVGHPTTGHKAGVVFIKQIIGGHPDEALYEDEARDALNAILAAGVETARDRYSDETAECWACGTELTLGLSRSVKIGPDCCVKRYGMTQAQRLELISHVRAETGDPCGDTTPLAG
jgi:hypothetical protein